jgi:hypothetical protein
MAQPFSYDVRILTGAKEKGGAGVTQIVESDCRWKACSP